MRLRGILWERIHGSQDAEPENFGIKGPKAHEWMPYKEFNKRIKEIPEIPEILASPKAMRILKVKEERAKTNARLNEEHDRNLCTQAIKLKNKRIAQDPMWAEFYDKLSDIEMEVEVNENETVEYLSSLDQSDNNGGRIYPREIYARNQGDDSYEQTRDAEDDGPGQGDDIESVSEADEEESEVDQGEHDRNIPRSLGNKSRPRKHRQRKPRSDKRGGHNTRRDREIQEAGTPAQDGTENDPAEGREDSGHDRADQSREQGSDTGSSE